MISRNLLMKSLLLTFCCSFLSFFTAGQSGTIELEKILLTKAYENKQPINLSEIVEDVEYIPLETGKDFVVGRGTRVFVDQDYLVVISFRQQYVFNRKTGKFICEVGICRKDPNGYRNTRSNLAYSSSSKSINAMNWDKGITEYSIDGKIIRKIKKPADILQIKSIVFINDSIGLASISTSGDMREESLISLNCNNGNYTKLPLYDYFERNPKAGSTRGESEGWFYKFNNKVFIKGCYNDTVFEISDKNVLPKYEFYSGKFKMSSEQRHFVSMKDWPKYHFVSKVFESDHYLFFTLHYNDVVRNGIYDKKKSKTYIADSKNVELHLYRWEMYGINNDIHNFIQFAPHYKNDKEEIVASVSALEVVNWFRENPDKAKQLPAHLQKLKDIKETDNPLVMIAKLKD